MDSHPDSHPDSNPHRDLIARVVAWHNRQPLARRITADQVRGIGVVALPFRAAQGATAAAGAPHPAGRGAVEPTWDAEAGAGAEQPAPAGAEVSELSLPERAAARLQAGADEPAAPPDGDADAALHPPEAAAHEPHVDASDPAAASATAAPLAAALAPARKSYFAMLSRWWPPRRAAAAGVSASALTPAFNEDFIAPLKPRQVARFARRHGSAERPGDNAEPQRDVLADAAQQPVVLLYLRSAAIEADGRRLRVLVGAGAKAAVIGPRLWSRPRIGGAAALCLSCLVAASAALWLPGRLAAQDGAATVALLAEPAASAASLVAVADASAPMPADAVAAAASQAVAEHAPAVAAAPAAELAASAPLHGATEVVVASVPASASAPASAASAASAADTAEGAGKQTAGVRPDIRPQLTAEQRDAARREGEQLRAQSPARKGSPLAAAGNPGVAIGDGHNYALVTRATRGRAASEVMLSLIVSAAAGTPGAGPGQPRAEVMQVPQGWRAVWWPFASLGDAEGARAALAHYGINAEIVEF